MIRLGTRASKLALAQTRWVAERLGEEAEIVTINATGPVDDKSRWVSELERALLEDRIDLAVHSAKDVPTELPEGLELVAIPVRADPRDAICGAPSLGALAGGARVGTSSLRRAAQLRALRADLEVNEVRGNVDTRLRKLAEGQHDALVLAAAGLQRLGLEPDGILDELVPAAGQGALAIEARAGHAVAGELIDPDAAACVSAERELVHALGASCNTPVGAHARTVDGGLELSAWVGLPDGSEWLRDLYRGGLQEAAPTVARRLLSTGARGLLRRAERELTQ
ncbi:MAG: hydroxymethylbilane synthase [Solirubrobacterales bacterium]|nr:hydroxymethylbilane synthase [Solirubrobacterales bacterium]